MRHIEGTALVPGRAAGPVLWSDTGLSFMGGVDPVTGTIIDAHHPLHGRSVAGTILVLPSGRGSCSGSLALFELLMNGHAPRALVFRHRETILTLGVVIAAELFGRAIPVLQVDAAGFAALADLDHARIDETGIAPGDGSDAVAEAWLTPLDTAALTLTEADRAMLDGAQGDAARTALRIVARTALLEGADSLVDIEMAHIDGCFYHGPASLAFARRMRDLGARCRVPATTNALCVDRRRWRAEGVPDALGTASENLAALYVEMGVTPSFTCAPYHLDRVPAFGQQIAWSESNAVVYANSVLGARTLKYPDYLDLMVAITGRAPNAGCHLGEGRLARLRIDVPCPDAPDDAFWPLLGYHVGKVSTNTIPVVCGLETLDATPDDLRAFGAAFATTSAAAMFHVHGLTPEAESIAQATGPAGTAGPDAHVAVTRADLAATWAELNTAGTEAVDLISLGNPHFSLDEFARLAALCDGHRIAEGVGLVVTCGRDVQAQAVAAGHVARIEAFGARVLTDTCWCFIGEPVVPPEAKVILTNSGKYAHYGPAAVRRGFRFASLAACVEAARTGRVASDLPDWLRG